MDRSRARPRRLDHLVGLLCCLCTCGGCSEESRIEAPPRDEKPAGTTGLPPDSAPPHPAAKKSIADGGPGESAPPQPKEARPRPTEKAEAPAKKAEAPTEKVYLEAVPPPPPPTSVARPESGQGTPKAAAATLESARAQAEEALKKATVAFNKPGSMRLGDTVPIQLRLSRSSAPDALTKKITGPGPVETAEVVVSKLVVARLSGAGFEITAGVGSDRPQAIKPAGDNYWEWDVTALSPGKHELHLTVSSIVRIEGTEAEDQILSYDEPIDIDVTWGQRLAGFVGSNWQWLGTVVVIPVGGYLFSKRRRGTSPTAGPPPAGGPTQP